jgi:ethanolamine utilization protein EutA (predicted chaperonin)
VLDFFVLFFSELRCSFFIIISFLLSSFSGLVVDLGHGCTQIAVIANGKVSNGIKLNIGGIDVANLPSAEEKVKYFVDNGLLTNILASCAQVGKLS